MDVMLANKYNNKTNVDGWWMSEKLDGVRAIWTGSDFISRLGNKFYAPAFFKQNLPADLILDGELYMSRGKFQSTVSIIKAHNKINEWKDIKFHVFDVVDYSLDFEERYKLIEKYSKYQTIVQQKKIKDIDHLNRELEKVTADGGEGLMLRCPHSKYAGGRSNNLLKVKKFQDAEGIVIEHLPGKGKYVGMTGSLKIEIAGGITFNLGSGLTDESRRNPPAIGSKVTFRYQELSSFGIPRFPVYCGVRID